MKGTSVKCLTVEQAIIGIGTLLPLVRGWHLKSTDSDSLLQPSIISVVLWVTIINMGGSSIHKTMTGQL